MTAQSIARIAAVLSVTACCVFCGRPADDGAQQSTRPDTNAALRPVALPDLTSAASSVREQLQGRHAEATRAAESGTPNNERLAGSFGELGQLLMAAEFLDAAEPAFLNAQTLAPRDPRWPYYLGRLHWQRNELDKAAAALERVRTLRPDYAPASIALAEVHIAGGRLEAAETALTDALSRDPQNPAAFGVLGRARLARRDYRGAIEFLERALTADPQASSLHYPLALAYQSAGDAAAAARHFARRGTAAPRLDDPWMRELAAALESAAVYDRLSRAALARGDWKAAMEYARRGVRLAGENPQVEAPLRHRLGTAHAQMGNAAAAYEEFQRAVKAWPDFAPGHQPWAHAAGGWRIRRGRRTVRHRAQARSVVRGGPHCACRGAPASGPPLD